MEPNILIAIVTFILGGTAFQAYRALRKAPAEAGAIGVETLRGVIKELRDEADRLRRVIDRLEHEVAEKNKQIARQDHQISEQRRQIRELLSAP